ncbi:helix-turn-helix domain-containing protein [Priestia megaterium]|nr:helix-turn-helix domain-containing protein [Priestia megaterium]
MFSHEFYLYKEDCTLNTKNDEKIHAQSLLKQGMKPKKIAETLGVHISTIYNWKKELDAKPSKSNSISSSIPKTNKNENIDFKTENAIEKLQNENEHLKKKVRDLEQIVGDLIIKLKNKNDEWLNE